MPHAEFEDFIRPIVTVDLVVFALGAEGLQLLVARRAAPPYAGDWALPGGFVHADTDGDLAAAARRVLAGKTGVPAPYLEQVASFGSAGRDPRGWSVSVAYMALVQRDAMRLAMGDTTAELRWVAADDPLPLAFDHDAIRAAARDRLRSKVGYSNLPAHLLPPLFTLGELQGVYEQILGMPLEKSAFRKRVAEADFVVAEPGQMRRGSNRPAQLYRLRRHNETVLFDRPL